MSERANQLHSATEGQIEELIDLISTLDEAALRLPCPAREKLGDGTVAASARHTAHGTRHTADNYQRIAAFVQTSDRMSGAREPTQPGAHRVPRFLRALRHGPGQHTERGSGDGAHTEHYWADNIDLGAVVDQLSASRDGLRRIAELTDSQLDAIAPKDSFRFCDGERTLEQVLASLLKHQRHQLDALKAATRSQPSAT